MKKLLLSLTAFLTVLILAACSTSSAPKMKVEYAELPAGKAFAEGEVIYFMHTETSDPQIADLLSKMMDSPVLTVPALADAPESMTSVVYVFENGVKGMGPLGFQSDVFDNPPGSAGYTPLRKITKVAWQTPENAVELKSAADVLKAADAGDVTLTPTGIVVNMPFVTWKDGKR